MDEGKYLILSTGVKLDLESTLLSGQAHRWKIVNDWYEGVIFKNLIYIRNTRQGPEFYCTPTDEGEFTNILIDYLGLKDDLDLIYESISKDANISSAIKKYRGMRILRQDPWECLIAFICSANSSIIRISSTMETLAENFGQPIKFNENIRYSFPSPHVLAEVGESKLRKLKLGFRAKYVAKVAKLVSEGEIDLMELRNLSYTKAKEKLIKLPGVGNKIADCVLLFSLDKTDAFPIDRWVKRALEDWYGIKLFNYSKIREWALEYFGEFAGYAQQYLFHQRRLQ